MFEDGNRIRFARPVDAVARQWWTDKFYRPFGLTPEGMANSLTQSAPEPKFAGSWAQMKRDALVFLLGHETVLGPARTNDFVRRINQGGPEAIRIIAAIDDPVPSRQLPQRFEPRLVPFARAFFLEHTGNWYGSVNLRDAATLDVVASYREGKKGSGR
jgi:hypothetical protein